MWITVSGKEYLGFQVGEPVERANLLAMVVAEPGSDDLRVTAVMVPKVDGDEHSSFGRWNAT